MPSLPATKKRRAGEKGVTLTPTQVKSLGTELLSSREHINNLPRLISILSPSSPPELLVESLLSVQAFFVPLIPDIPSRSSAMAVGCGGAGERDHEAVYKEWLRSRFDEFVQSLIGIALSAESEEAIVDVVLDAIMEFVKLGKGGKFESAIYHKFLNSLVYATSSPDVSLNLFVAKFFKYIDVRYHAYISLAKIASKCGTTSATENSKVTQLEECQGNLHNSETSLEASTRSIYTILSRIPCLESVDAESDYKTWSESGLSFSEGDQADASLADGNPQKLSNIHSKVASTTLITKKYKAKFTKAWRSFLSLPLPLNVYKEVLASLHQIVIPNIANPVFLCDFLTRSYDIGGVIGVMALSGLYILMTQHGLEYPNYYTKLYALLTPPIFIAKYRARFFQLLDTSLKSAYIPAYLAAAFAKKLSRLALVVPPSGALIIIAIIHNLLRRHPSINFLVHKSAGGDADGDASSEVDKSVEPAEKTSWSSEMPEKLVGFDPFKIEESDPVKSGAMRSSLWEIDSLRHHYCPAVSRFVASLENDLTVRNKTSEVTVADFVSGSYSTIFGSEIRRRIKQVPLSFYSVAPTSLFSGSDFPGWSFKGSQCDKMENEALNKLEGDEDHEMKRRRIECTWHG